jgi:hypothetical protein
VNSQGHLVRRYEGVLQSATRTAMRGPRLVRGGLHHALYLRDRYQVGQVSVYCPAVRHRQLRKKEAPATINPTKATPRTSDSPMWNRRSDRLNFLQVPGPDATNRRTQVTIRCGEQPKSGAEIAPA